MPLKMFHKVIRFFENNVFMERECGDVTEHERDDRCADVPRAPVQEQEIRRELHNRSGSTTQDIQENLFRMMAEERIHRCILRCRYALCNSMYQSTCNCTPAGSMS